MDSLKHGGPEVVPALVSPYLFQSFLSFLFALSPVSKIKNSGKAGANVVGKVAIEENKLKAVSNPVWVCLEAMI